MEWYHRDTAWHHRVLAINDVLKVLNKALVQWVQVRLSVHKLQESVVLVDSQIFDQLLFLCRLFGLWKAVELRLKTVEYSSEGWVASVYQVAKVVDRGRLVLNQNED